MVVGALDDDSRGVKRADGNMFTVRRPVQAVSQRKTPLDGLKGQRFFCNNLLAPSGGCVTEIPRIVYLVVRTTPAGPHIGLRMVRLAQRPIPRILTADLGGLFHVAGAVVARFSGPSRAGTVGQPVLLVIDFILRFLTPSSHLFSDQQSKEDQATGSQGMSGD